MPTLLLLVALHRASEVYMGTGIYSIGRLRYLNPLDLNLFIIIMISLHNNIDPGILPLFILHSFLLPMSTFSIVYDDSTLYGFCCLKIRFVFESNEWKIRVKD